MERHATHRSMGFLRCLFTLAFARTRRKRPLKPLLGNFSGCVDLCRTFMPHKFWNSLFFQHMVLGEVI